MLIEVRLNFSHAAETDVIAALWRIYRSPVKLERKQDSPEASQAVPNQTDACQTMGGKERDSKETRPSSLAALA